MFKNICRDYIEKWQVSTNWNTCLKICIQTSADYKLLKHVVQQCVGVRWKQLKVWAETRRWVFQCFIYENMWVWKEELFCWPCVIAYQYNETNVMHFSFNLLRIKSLYMFRALLAQLQEALQKRHLVYCVRIMSVGCGTIAVKWNCNPATANWHHTHAIYQMPFVWRLLRMSK
jgi:hypothetical protein